MNRKTLWIISSMCLISLAVAGTLFFGHLRQAHAAGTPALFLAPTAQQPIFNDPTEFDGANFSPSSTVTLNWSYAPRGTFLAGTAQTNASGSFRFRIAHMISIPFEASLALTAIDSQGIQATANAIAHSPSFNVSPASGSIGTKVTAKGGGYGSNETINIYFQGAAVQKELVTSTTTDATGLFQGQFSVPPDASLGGNNDMVEAKGVSSQTDTFASFVVIPKITITPNHGPSGTTIVVKGEFFTPSTNPPPFATASLSWFDPTTKTSTFLLTLNTSATGTFQTTITAPSNLTSGVHYRVVASDDASGNNCFAAFTAN